MNFWTMPGRYVMSLRERMYVYGGYDEGAAESAMMTDSFVSTSDLSVSLAS